MLAAHDCGWYLRWIVALTQYYLPPVTLKLTANNVWPLSCGIHAANAFLLQSQ
jgi:hypothetical protein